MKKITRFFSLVVMLLLSTLILNGQSENITKTMGPNDSLTVNVKFEKVKLSKEETTVQEQINTLLVNSVNTTNGLASGIDRLTTALEKNVELSRMTKADIVANQLGITPTVINKAYKKNNKLLLVSLLPGLVFVFWSLTTLFKKGLDLKTFLHASALLGLYSLFGCGILYAVLSLVFNQQYFVIRNLMSSLF